MWTSDQIPLLTFVKNTVKITVVVTLLQLFTSSFAAYAFAKMQFKGKNALFLATLPPSQCLGRPTWCPSS